MARAREFLMNFPTGLSQELLAWVGSGYAIYNLAWLGLFSIEGLSADRDDKARRREQYIKEAVEARASAAAAAAARREARRAAAAAASNPVAAHGRQGSRQGWKNAR